MGGEWYDPYSNDFGTGLRDQAWDTAKAGFNSVAEFQEAREREVKVPGIGQRVDFIIRMWQIPCGASWYVYFETAWPAFLDMLITLSLAGFDDIIRGFARPKLPPGKNKWGNPKGRKGRHSRGKAKPPGRAKKGWHKVRPWLPIVGEPAGAMGGKLGGTMDMQGRKVTDGVRNLWILDGILQRLMWWWLVLEALSEFGYRWTTLLYETEACQESSNAYAVTTADELPIPALIGWHGLHVHVIEEEHNGASTWKGAVICPTPNADIVVACEFVQKVPGKGYGEIRIEPLVGSATHTKTVSFLPTEGAQARPAIVTTTLAKNTSASVKVRAIGGDLFARKCSVAVNGSLRRFIEPSEF